MPDNAQQVIEDVARQGAVEGNPEELLRFTGSLEGHSVAIRYKELGGKPTEFQASAKEGVKSLKGQTRRWGSFDTHVSAIVAAQRCPSAKELLEGRYSELRRAQRLLQLANMAAPQRRECLRQVTRAVFGQAGVLWLPGVPVFDQFDICLSVYPWAFLEMVEFVSHPEMAAASSVRGRLLIKPDVAGPEIADPEWMAAFVDRIEDAIVKTPEAFAQRLQWLDDSPKFRDPKGYIQVIMAWFGSPEHAQGCQERASLVLRQSKVPIPIRRDAVSYLIERMACNADASLLPVIEAAGTEWRKQDTGSNLPDEMLGVLAKRLRLIGFADKEGVLANHSFEIIEVLANASNYGWNGDGGSSLLRLLAEIIEASPSVSGGTVEQWIAHFRSVARSRIALPKACRRLVSRIWRECTIADNAKDKKGLRTLLALRRDLARLDPQLSIGEIDLVAVARQPDATMRLAFAISRRVMGMTWLPYAIRLHSELAQTASRPVAPAVIGVLEVAEGLVWWPYGKRFFHGLCSEFRDNSRASLREIVFREVWARFRKCSNAPKLASHLETECRKAQIPVDFARLMRDLPLPTSKRHWLRRFVLWTAVLFAVLGTAIGIVWLLAPNLVITFAGDSMRFAIDLWTKAVHFADAFQDKGDRK